MSTKFGSALVTTVVDEEDALHQIGYHNQGDAELSTAENMRERVGLRYASQVEDAIQAFWVVAKSTDAIAKETCVTQQSHEELYLRVHKALLKDFDLDDARVDVFADWQNDTRGDCILHRAGFGDSLFELTDVWSTGIGADEYESFLWKLYEVLTGVSRPNHASSWRSMDEISFVEHVFSGVGEHPKARRQRRREAHSVCRRGCAADMQGTRCDLAPGRPRASSHGVEGLLRERARHSSSAPPPRFKRSGGGRRRGGRRIRSRWR